MNQILYVENDNLVYQSIESYLNTFFPDLEVKLARDSEGVKELLDNEEVAIDRLALLCTDGFREFANGEDVAEILRDKGYKGPALHVGYTAPPEDKAYLFTGSAPKFGRKLIRAIREQLEQ